MKKFTALLLIFCFTLISVYHYSCITAHGAHFSALITYDGRTHEYTGTNFAVTLNGQAIHSPIPPIVLSDGCSIVAVREIFEALGATVLWLPGETDRVLIAYGSDYVALELDSNIASVNGVNRSMTVPAKLITIDHVTKTMVPARFVAETLNMAVDFDESSCTISINSTPENQPAPSPSPAEPSFAPTAIPSALPSVTPPESLKPTPAPTVSKKVVALSNKQSGDTLTTTLKLSAPFTAYEHQTLSDPNRIVVDIAGFETALPQTAYKTEGNTYQIRNSNYNGKARIVFDVHAMPEYVITPSDDRMSITVTLTAKYEKKSPIVVIDAGHGGTESGAIGYNDDGSIDLIEKDVNLPVALMVVDILKNNGVDVRTTRTTDTYVSLKARTDMANSIGASLFVSIHCNAFTTTDIHGTLVMHHTTKDTSAYGVSGRQLAQNIMDRMVPALGTADKGRVNGDTMWVIRNANMPSVIVEMAFITNKADRALLKTDAFRSKAAQAIAAGIMDTIPSLAQ